MNHSSLGIKKFTKNSINPFEYNSEVDKNISSQQIQINKQFLPKVFGLSRTGIKLLLYLLTNQSKDFATIYFDLKECKLFTGFTDKRSIYNGLIELLGENIIARTENENTYYLNIDIINTGSDHTK